MQPLSGIKVIDLSTWVFAPCCSATLGDWGAEVIKIEDPKTGDLYRWFLMVAGIDESDSPISLFGLENRNKRGMALELKHPEGRDVLYRLVEEADIFVSNIPAAALKRLELDYPSLSAINQRLIYAHASGYGEEGPDVNKPGFDATAYWARSGLMAALAVGGQPPVSQQIPAVGDHASGLALFGGVLLALYNREKTGQGQEVDLSLLGTGTHSSSSGIQYYLSMGEEPPRYTRNEIINPLVNYYKTKDDKWIYLVSLPDELYWTPLCNAFDNKDLEVDPKFSTRESRLENNLELIGILDKIISGKTEEQWAKLFDENGIIWTHIPMSFEEVAKDPQMLANDHIVEVEHPSYGPTKIMTSPIRLNKETPAIKRLAPELGQHTEEVLLELNYTWDDIIRFKENGVIL